ncbi:ATP-binding protein [Streptomyces sp. NPDC058289]|uniref:ATP-binding protein n=1 Tax=Streptomyces sp. NPDC058289 TaxID=3346425 RepID=UPI0036ECD014
MLLYTTERSPRGFRVPAMAGEVSRARRRVVAIARDWQLPLDEEYLQDLELLASEVITNAVEHTEGTSIVCVRWTGVRVRVEVSDGDPCELIPAVSGPDEESGRGLLLVTSLAASWGTHPHREGKVVWFEIGPAVVPVAAAKVEFSAGCRHARDDASSGGEQRVLARLGA